MKKNILLAASMAACLSLSSCGFGGTTGATNTNSQTASAAGAILGSVLGTDGTGESILGSVLGSLLGSTITQQNLIGTWTYQTPKVAFESENLLAKAGGLLAAQKVESTLTTYLSKVGIKQGTSTFTFNEDGTYVITTKGKTISTGNYTYNAKAKTLQMTGMLGLTQLNCSVGANSNYTYLMFGADKLLAGANALTSILGQGTLSSLLGNYSGMQVGFTLSK
ncbi:MAG: DUF4923 family protein [Bacteroidaceae bacterium]|nr:DUF4923 family protein [Bacteroidaceae bacterium]